MSSQSRFVCSLKSYIFFFTLFPLVGLRRVQWAKLGVESECRLRSEFKFFILPLALLALSTKVFPLGQVHTLEFFPVKQALLLGYSMAITPSFCLTAPDLIQVPTLGKAVPGLAPRGESPLVSCHQSSLRPPS